MTLRSIIVALGGDLYAGGARANVPAPGHSAADRSVSLLLEGDRLVIHSFGAATWREVRDQLCDLGLVDRNGRILGSGGATPGLPVRPDRPDRPARIAAARRLWEGAAAIGPASLSRRYLAGRAIAQDPAALAALRHHPAAPVSVYVSGRLTRPALVAAIRDPTEALTAVELVYLTAGGGRDERLRTPRKMIGVLPPGSAVRLAAAAPELLVAEGVLTVLSASAVFGLPAWALLTAHNLSLWSPPPGVRRVVIAADRDRAGEAAAARLAERLRAAGLGVAVSPPPADAEDWNAFAMAEARTAARREAERRKEGG